MTKIAINTKHEYELSLRQINEFLLKEGHTNIKFIFNKDFKKGNISLAYNEIPEVEKKLSENNLFKNGDFLNNTSDTETSLCYDQGDKGRSNKNLIEAIEKYPDDITGLKIVEIPDNVDWIICRDNYWGNEWIAEKHRTWG